MSGKRIPRALLEKLKQRPRTKAEAQKALMFFAAMSGRPVLTESISDSTHSDQPFGRDSTDGRVSKRTP